MARLLVICFALAVAGCGEDSKPAPAAPAGKAATTPPPAGKGKTRPPME